MGCLFALDIYAVFSLGFTFTYFGFYLLLIAIKTNMQHDLIFVKQYIQE